MHKRLIDNWITDNYTKLLLLSTGMTVRYKRNVDPPTLVSNCYEYLIDRQDELNEDIIEQWACTYITMQVVWTNSNTNKEELQTATPFYKTLQYDPSKAKEEVDGIDDKVIDEQTYQEYKAILTLYLQKIRHDKVKVRLLEVIFRDKNITSRKLAEHFNISHTGAWLQLKALKEDIQAFKREINNYDKLNNFNGGRTI